MSDFSFGGINVASKKHVLKLDLLKNPVLLDQSNMRATYDFDVVVLVDEPYNKFQLKSIKLFLEGSGITRFKIVAALNCAITKEAIKEDQKEGLIAFYRNNSANFWPEIPERSVIITVGSALYAVTRSDDVYPTDTMQFIFGRPSIWYSKDQSANGHWVYPIESFKDIFAQGFSAKAVDSYKTKLAQFQLNRVKSRADLLPPAGPSEVNKVFIETAAEFDRFFEANKHRKNEIVAWDLETSGFNFLTDKVGCIAISFDGVTGYYIPWSLVDKRKINYLLSNNIQLGANLKFDCKFLWREGLPAAAVQEDIVVLGHVLDETRSNSLKALAYYYTIYGGYDFELEEYKRLTGVDNYLEIPEELLREYAVMDAIVTWRVYDNMIRHTRALDKKYPNEKGTNWTVEDYYRKIRIPAVNMFARVEYKGVYVDPDKLGVARSKVQSRIDEIHESLSEKLGVPKFFDFGSTKELGKLLDKLNWRDLGRGADGVLQTADFQLLRWAEEHPEAALIQELRSCKVMLNTFLGDLAGTKGWSQYLQYHPEDNSWRIHPNFTAMGTESGRTKCREPNMMNVPTHGDFAKEIKKCLVTPNDDEYYMITVDYSALQMRLAAIDCNDPVLCEVFSSGKKADIHSKTAYGVFIKGKKWRTEEIHVEQDRKEFHFLGGEIVNTVNRGEVFASELLETDTIAC